MNWLKKLYYRFKYGRLSVLDSKDNRDWRVPDELIPIGNASLTEFSREDKLIPIQSQGKTNTCVAQAARVCFHDTPDYKESPLISEWYLFHWARIFDELATNDPVGTTLSGVCKALHKKGALLDKYWENGVDPPSDLIELDKEASQRKIKAYYNLLPYDKKFEEKLKGLIQNECVLYAFHVKQGFYDTSGVISPDSYTGNSLGGHAVAVTGWKHINGELYWKIRNSWSKNWADNGSCYMHHKIFKENCFKSGLYYIVTQSETQSEIPLEIKKKSKKNLFVILGSVAGGILALWGLSQLF